MDEVKCCESCGMFLTSDEVLGTEKGGAKSGEYCMYCYQDGAFTSNHTMEEMITLSVAHMKEMGVLAEQNKTEEEARAFMAAFFPKLKRWKQ